MDIKALGHWGSRIFWQSGCFGTWAYFGIGAKILLSNCPYCCASCQNIHLPKFSRAEMFLRQKFLMPKSPRAEKSPCRNVPMLKCPSAGTSAAPNGACAKMFPWWNIRAEMTLAKIFRAQMVCRRAYTYGTQCKYVDYNGVWEIRVVSYCLNYYQLLSLDTVPIGKYKKTYPQK